MQGTGGDRQSRAVTDSGGAWTPREWFTRAPYPGAWLALSVGLLLGSAAIALNRPRPQTRVVMVNPAPPPAPESVLAPAPAAPATNAPGEAGDEPPQVRVRTLHPPPPRPGNAPAAKEPSVAPPPLSLPGTIPVPPTGPGNAPLPGGSLDEPVPAPAAPEASPPREPVEPRPVQEARPRPLPEPAEPPAPRPRPAPPARETGRLLVYFDADSSTFDRDDRRMPLRVEVYVDGVKRLDTDDPEKREFDLGRVPEGRHDVQIVPYVGEYPSDPRREVVAIEPGQRNRFKAVLRKSSGMSRIAKFAPRD